MSGAGAGPGEVAGWGSSPKGPRLRGDVRGKQHGKPGGLGLSPRPG